MFVYRHYETKHKKNLVFDKGSNFKYRPNNGCSDNLRGIPQYIEVHSCIITK